MLELEQIRSKLTTLSGGDLQEVAYRTSLTTATLYNIRRGQKGLQSETLKKLSDYFQGRVRVANDEDENKGEAES